MGPLAGEGGEGVCGEEYGRFSALTLADALICSHCLHSAPPTPTPALSSLRNPVYGLGSLLGPFSFPLFPAPASLARRE